MVVNLPYGESSITFSPESLDILGVLVGAQVAPVADQYTALKKALNKPISSPPLHNLVSPGETVAVIVNDHTRVANTVFFLPVLMAELRSAGVKEQDIVIIFANGAHSPVPDDKQHSLLGEEYYQRYHIVNHNCHDRRGLACVGETSRGNRVEINRTAVDVDKILLTGSILFHFMAGFSGGRKAIVPGIAGYNTICFNHKLMLEDGTGPGKLQGNPVHEDLVEAARLVKPAFLLNVVLNEKEEFLGFFAGDYLAAHYKGCELAERAFAIPLSSQAELVIASCGGFPRDLNLYQAQKTLLNAVRAVVPGGVVILAAKCSEGWGSAELKEWLGKYSSAHEIKTALQKEFVVGGHKAYALSKLTETASVIMVSSMPPAEIKKTGMIPAENMAEAIAAAKRLLGKRRPAAYLMPQGALTLPIYPPD